MGAASGLVESLEDRRLLSATYSVDASGNLVITADGEQDYIVLAEQEEGILSIQLGSLEQVFALGGITHVTVNTGGGVDEVAVSSHTIDFVINLEGGGDEFAGFFSGTADADIYGSGGGDRLFASNTGSGVVNSFGNGGADTITTEGNVNWDIGGGEK